MYTLMTNFFFSSSGAVGGEGGDEDDKEKEEEAERERQEAIREAEERRKEKHRKMEEEREKMRQEIRDKVRYTFYNLAFFLVSLTSSRDACYILSSDIYTRIFFVIYNYIYLDCGIIKYIYSLRRRNNSH